MVQVVAFLPLANIDEVQFDSIVVLHLDGRNKERPAENLAIHLILNIMDSIKLKQVFESNRTTKTTMLGGLNGTASIDRSFWLFRACWNDSTGRTGLVVDHFP